MEHGIWCPCFGGQIVHHKSTKTCVLNRGGSLCGGVGRELLILEQQTAANCHHRLNGGARGGGGGEGGGGGGGVIDTLCILVER